MDLYTDTYSFVTVGTMEKEAPQKVPNLQSRQRSSKPITDIQKNPSQVEDTPPTTPTAMFSSAHDLAQEIQSIYSSLTGLTSLAPGPQVNPLLTRLVELCTMHRSSEFARFVLQLKGMSTLSAQLRPLCAAAEGELEKHWAHRFLSAPNGPLFPVQAQTLLHTFPYHQNYLDLSRLECSTLEAFLPLPILSSLSPSFSRASTLRIAFIGSGPLPLTSFCMLDRYPSATIHNVDRDFDALEMSRELAMRLGYGDRMTFECQDVSGDVERRGGGCINGEVEGEGEKDAVIWTNFSVVFLAALVGMDTDSKLTILAALAKKLSPGTLVVVRSAWGLKSLLYPILELSEEVQRIGFEILVVVHPWTKVVNSVIVLRVKG